MGWCLADYVHTFTEKRIGIMYLAVVSFVTCRVTGWQTKYIHKCFTDQNVYFCKIRSYSVTEYHCISIGFKAKG